MLLLVLAVLIGILFGYLATQNTSPVQISLLGMTFAAVPVYIVALFSLLGGLLLSGIFTLLDWISSSLTIRKKDRQLLKTQETIRELENEIQHLKGDMNAIHDEETPVVRKELSFADRMRGLLRNTDQRHSF